MNPVCNCQIHETCCICSPSVIGTRPPGGQPEAPTPDAVKLFLFNGIEYIKSNDFKTLQARAEELERQLEARDIYINDSYKQLLHASAKIIAKDEALGRCRDSIAGYKDCNGLAKDSVLHIAMDKAIDALTDSPAAAKESIARMERMEKALDLITKYVSVNGGRLARKNRSIGTLHRPAI